LRKQPDHETTLESVTDALAEFDEDGAGLPVEIAKTALAEPEVLQEVAEQTPYGEIFLTDLISRQLTLSLTVAITFLTILFTIPLFNYFMPAVATVQIFGFTVSWLVVGVVIYPVIWGLAYYFVGTCKKFEDDFIQLVN
jgi:hypothetical protein